MYKEYQLKIIKYCILKNISELSFRYIEIPIEIFSTNTYWRHIYFECKQSKVEKLDTSNERKNTK